MATKSSMDAMNGPMPAMPEQDMLHGMPRHEVEGAVRTLQEAHKVKKNSKLHSAAKKHAKTQAQDLEDLADSGADEASEDAKPVSSLDDLKKKARKKMRVY